MSLRAKPIQELDYKSVTRDELKEKLDRREEPILLDVCEPWEFALADCPEGHAPDTPPSSRPNRSTPSDTLPSESSSARSRSRRSASVSLRANSASSSV